MVKNEKEDNKPESTDSQNTNSEGGTHSIQKEYQSLLNQYKRAAFAFEAETDKLIASGKDIDKAALASIVTKRVALAKAEKSLALCVTLQMQEKNVDVVQKELEKQRRDIIELRKNREEKVKKLKEKIEELGKDDTLAQFLLPGRWLDDYKEQQVKDVTTLKQEVVKLDKVIESKTSKLSPSERVKLEAETKEILDGAGKESVVSKSAVVSKKLEVKSQSQSPAQAKSQPVNGKQLPEDKKPQDQKLEQSVRGKQYDKAEVIREKMTVKPEYKTSNANVVKPALTPEEAREIAEQSKKLEQDKKPGRELKKDV